MPGAPPQFDVLILGGGIAGLWALRRLRAAGHHATLLTNSPLGNEQTLASQGIIHGGIKYALGGAATRASEAIAAMPEVWRRCLSGAPPAGHPDLRSARVLAESQYLWTTPGFISKVAGAAAGKAIRTPVEKLSVAQRPLAFAGAPDNINVYEVGEPVLDVRSVVSALAGGAAGQEHAIAWMEGVEAIEQTAGGVSVRVRVGDQWQDVAARKLILCAGAGNQALLTIAGVAGAQTNMQRRPLHMVMARGGELPALFGHCLGASSVPRLTICSATDLEGRPVWYVGGRIAEEGVDRDTASQIRVLREEARACVPWADLANAQFATLRIDRAEGLTSGGKRPDEPVVLVRGSIIAAWPTKLAFAPLLADRLLEAVGAPASGAAGVSAGTFAEWRRANVGALPWNDPDVEWMR